MMDERIKEQIDTLVNQFQNEVPIKQIILFGSVAQGKLSKNSDLDVCVITENSDIRRLDLIRRLRRAIVPYISIPVDILVYNQNEFEERAENLSTFEYKIKSEGIKLHEQ